MKFTDWIFVVFFAVFFLLYWIPLKNKHKSQNIALFAGSLIFYGWWDWRFLLLLMSTIIITYLCAIKIEDTHRKSYTYICAAYNLLLLFFFKYFNFFSENLQELFSLFGVGLDWFTLEVLLPVGISFYTFQAIGYIIDVQREEIKAERNFISFGVFLSYFPQLVAGPIERAASLLPQINRERRWDYGEAVQGMRQALWGMVKKVVISDGCSLYVDYFETLYGGSRTVAALMSTLLFSVQIYCDFSGYCDIACGVSRSLGIRLMQNFRYPYFSHNVQEFWRRWNISLMLWFRDYVYIPLGGSRRGMRRTIINTIIVFTLSGIWHGARWNFVIWGVYWGVMLVIHRLIRPYVPKSLAAWSIPATCVVTVISFAIFFSKTIENIFIVVPLIILPLLALGLAGGLIIFIFSKIRIRKSIIDAAAAIAIICYCIGCILFPRLLELTMATYIIFFIALLFVVEWHNRSYDYVMERFDAPSWIRMATYMFLVFLLLTNQYEDIPFIYFQF